MIWHLHKWTKWRSFTYVGFHEERLGEISIWRDERTAMQEKTCRKCGKLKQRKV